MNFSFGDKKKLIDYIFWIVFIFFTNPGGILEALGEDSGDGGINVKDILFIVLFLCYVLVHFNSVKIKDESYNKTLKYLIFFILYHFLIFSYFVPVFKGSSHSLSFIIIKNRHDLISIVLFVLVYEFYLRSYKVFFRVLISSSIIVIALFLMTISFGVDILTIEKMDRDFVKIDRLMMISYGLMPLLIPIGAVLIIFKNKIPWRKLMLMAFGLMFLTWFLSLTRRHILGSILYIFLAMLIHNFILKKSLIPLNKVFSATVYALILLVFINFSFPKYIDAGVKTIEQTIYVLEHGETTTGRKDKRLGLGKEFMQNLIRENFIFGTGFDNRWRTAEGDKAGYEAADYPFLSALAMKGIIGVLLFLPVYIILIKSIINNLKFLRSRSIDFNTIQFFILMVFILYFVYDLIQYMNWFKTVSLTKNYKWFVILSMYLASVQIFQQNLGTNQKTK